MSLDGQDPEAPEVKKEDKRETPRRRRQRREAMRRAAGPGLASAPVRALVAFEDHRGHDLQLDELRRKFKKVTDDVELNLAAPDRARGVALEVELSGASRP